MFTTYALYSPSHDRLYVGQTSNMELRFKQHNEGATFATKPYPPWILIHCEAFNTRAEAMHREKELKSHAGRAFLRSRIPHEQTEGL